MKKTILISVTTAVLILSGCSSKTPSIDESTQQKPQEVKAIDTETVSSEDSMVNSSDDKTAGSNSAMSDMEMKFTPVYFAYDKFDITTKMAEEVERSAELANNSFKDYNIKLEGNCDEWGSDEYNFALGLKRSNAVKKALIAEGVKESRISMISYGESNPTCTDKTQACWSKNRRVDFKILP